MVRRYITAALHYPLRAGRKQLFNEKNTPFITQIIYKAVSCHLFYRHVCVADAVFVQIH